jgi:hypothetical protein
MKAPVFEIAKCYEPGDQQDMLVRNAHLGTGLAKVFSNTPESKPPSLDHSVVLMRRHGYTTHGPDIETAVYRAIYTKINAAAQTKTAIIRNAFVTADGGGKDAWTGFEPMSQEMLDGCQRMNIGTQDKPWRLWVAEVENSKLYVNEG